MKRKHAQPNVESMIENPKIYQFTENGLVLRHPFNMMVAASTGRREDLACQKST